MNSVLQCLLYARPLTMYFTQGRYRKDLNRTNPMGCKGELAEEYSALVVELNKRCYRYLAPKFFKATLASFAPQFEGTQQQDAQEFASFFLDGLHEDLNRVRKKVCDCNLDGMPDHLAADKAWNEYLTRHNSIIVDLFQGQYRSAMRCLTCGHESLNFSPFMFLTLPIPANPSVDIRACLQEFVRAERVNGWRCPKCKCARDASKTLSIWRLPPLLMIHLKRFTFSGPFRDKLSTRVDFPLTNLKIQDGVANPKLQEQKRDYKLFGVSNHYGNMSGGHYIAFCRDFQSRRWYKFDDSAVSPMPESQVCSNAAYLLFYSCLDFDHLGNSF
ncbi:uncharacterized protein MONBRDRAFT_19778 [Monosiga brevicollis MX1]|uniref:ubiquitinyl hydrolase 1 n=1 Tax=Monosiga brevicollis TaxID=81824 RepID=A9URC5_MONBE|nr:uncharacterized protein MONBRDRAFT_19778 [Monosiga brevicollis MX1]EDQ92219.1 predicted protein [Monosiga brevicollis MX1]|eukprot:XP_001743505.1 hypothetical protein [Monosiga brevicollis MX1]